MTEVLVALLGYLYWIALVGGIGWWIWAVRRSSTPPKRSATDSAELARVRAALADLDQARALGGSDREQARGR